jgi:hypothetical protein
MLRLEGDRLVVARHGVGAAPELLQRIAAVVEGFGIVGPKRDRLVVAFHRVGEAPERHQRVAEIEIGLGMVRLDFQRLANQLDRFRVPALPVAQGAEQMLRVEVIGLRFENLPIQGLRFRQPALPVKGNGLVDQLGQVGRGLSGGRRFGLRINALHLCSRGSVGCRNLKLPKVQKSRVARRSRAQRRCGCGR